MWWHALLAFCGGLAVPLFVNVVGSGKIVWPPTENPIDLLVEGALIGLVFILLVYRKRPRPTP